jgi:hypothetical protein
MPLWPLDLAVGEDDAVDRDRLAVGAAGGQGRVGVGHLQRRDADPQAADPLRRDPVEFGRDPHRFRRLRHALGPDVEVELGEHGVVGADRRLLQVDRSLVALVGGRHLPVAPVGEVEIQRFRRVVGRVGVDALLDRGRQHEGLEGRAGLAAALGGEVELGLLVAGAGDHRPNPAVAGVDRDQRRRGVGRVRQRTAHRFQPDLLQAEVDRGVDLEAAAADQLGAVLGDQLVFDVVEEVGLLVFEVALGDVEPEALPLRRLRPLGRGVALLGHLPQHLVAARFRRARVEDRVVFGGRLRQPRQQRRLRQAQLRDRPREVDPRGGADPDRGRAFDRPVGGHVEVGAEDFLAAVDLGVLFGQLRLLDLALDRPLGILQAEVAD